MADQDGETLRAVDGELSSSRLHAMLGGGEDSAGAYAAVVRRPVAAVGPYQRSASQEAEDAKEDGNEPANYEVEFGNARASSGAVAAPTPVEAVPIATEAPAASAAAPMIPSRDPMEPILPVPSFTAPDGRLDAGALMRYITDQNTALIERLINAQTQQSTQMHAVVAQAAAAASYAATSATAVANKPATPVPPAAPPPPASQPARATSSGPKIPKEVDENLGKLSSRYETLIRKFLRSQAMNEKLGKMLSGFDDEVKHSRYPPGVRPFKNSSQMSEMDELWTPCENQPVVVSITVSQGATRREALQCVHWLAAKHSTAVEVDLWAAHLENTKKAASKCALIQLGDDIVQEATKPRTSTAGLDIPPPKVDIDAVKLRMEGIYRDTLLKVERSLAAEKEKASKKSQDAAAREQKNLAVDPLLLVKDLVLDTVRNAQGQAGGDVAMESKDQQPPSLTLPIGRAERDAALRAALAPKNDSRPENAGPPAAAPAKPALKSAATAPTPPWHGKSPRTATPRTANRGSALARLPKSPKGKSPKGRGKKGRGGGKGGGSRTPVGAKGGGRGKPPGGTPGGSSKGKGATKEATKRVRFAGSRA